MKIEIGAMINGVFIKEGDNIRIIYKGAECRDGFYAVVDEMSEEKIYFKYEDGGIWWDESEKWSNLDLVELA